MRLSLAELLCDTVMELHLFYSNGTKLSMDQLLNWMKKYLAQLVTLAVQVVWTLSVESRAGQGLKRVGVGVRAYHQGFGW